MSFDWNWEFAFEILPRLLRATLNTLIAAGAGYGLAMVLGLIFALALRGPSKMPPPVSLVRSTSTQSLTS